MSKTMTNGNLYAFARGYYDARALGVSSNPFDGESRPMQHTLYEQGYEWGITDYCIEHHPEEITQ